jgi:hypothetical protein
LNDEDKREVIVRNLAAYDENKKGYPTVQLMRPDLDAESDDEEEARAVSGPIRKKSRELQQYVHFGLRKALLGDSIGILHRKNYFDMLRCVRNVDPRALATEFLEELSRSASSNEVNR